MCFYRNNKYWVCASTEAITYGLYRYNTHAFYRNNTYVFYRK